MAAVFFVQRRKESQKKGLAPTATPILCSCHSAGSHYFAQGSDIRASWAGIRRAGDSDLGRPIMFGWLIYGANFPSTSRRKGRLYFLHCLHSICDVWMEKWRNWANCQVFLVVEMSTLKFVWLKKWRMWRLRHNAKLGPTWPTLNIRSFLRW